MICTEKAAKSKQAARKWKQANDTKLPSESVLTKFSLKFVRVLKKIMPNDKDQRKEQLVAQVNLCNLDTRKEEQGNSARSGNMKSMLKPAGIELTTELFPLTEE